MDRNFARALPLILKHEGGFVHHPNDPGGATNKGVTLATFRAYVKPGGTVADLNAITDEQVATVYYRHYWAAVNAAALSRGRVGSHRRRRGARCHGACRRARLRAAGQGHCRRGAVLMSFLLSRAGAAMVSIIAAAIIATWAINSAYQAGRTAERTAILNRSVETRLMGG